MSRRAAKLGCAASRNSAAREGELGDGAARRVVTDDVQKDRIGAVSTVVGAVPYCCSNGTGLGPSAQPKPEGEAIAPVPSTNCAVTPHTCEPSTDRIDEANRVLSPLRAWLKGPTKKSASHPTANRIAGPVGSARAAPSVPCAGAVSPEAPPAVGLAAPPPPVPVVAHPNATHTVNKTARIECIRSNPFRLEGGVGTRTPQNGGMSRRRMVAEPRRAIGRDVRKKMASARREATTLVRREDGRCAALSVSR